MAISLGPFVFPLSGKRGEEGGGDDVGANAVYRHSLDTGGNSLSLSPSSPFYDPRLLLSDTYGLEGNDERRSFSDENEK